MAEFSNLNGYDVKDKKAVRVYDTVADMKADETLKEGQHIKTKGYYSVNDGGSGEYTIIDSDLVLIVDDGSLFHLDNGLYARLIINETINTMQFGIIPDTQNDVVTQLNAFFAAESFTYVIKKGTYVIDGNISINSNSKIVFEEGAIIQRKATSASNYYMLNVGNCENVEIINAHLVGDKDTHTGSTGEWGYGIHIWGSTNIIVRDSIIEKTWGDGIYIGYSYSDSNPTPCYHITIDNCKVLSCSRNGYAIGAGKYIKLINCYSYGTTRVDPKAGLDIESEGPNGSTLILDYIDIINFRSESNGYGIVTRINNDFTNIVIDNHNSINETIGFTTYGINNPGNIIYENSNIIKSRNMGISITKKNNNSLVLRNIVIDSRRISDNTHNYQGAVQINTTSADSGNIIIDNLKLIKTYSDLYEYQDIICETGTGTLSGLDLYNIESRKYLCLNNAGDTGVTLNNCKFYNIGIGATIDVDKRTIYNLINIYRPLADTTYRNVSDNLPDGTYEIQLSNNTVPYFLYVVFNSNLTVYKYDSQTAVSNTHRTSYKGGYMKFIKYGTTITILQSTFTPYTSS